MKKINFLFGALAALAMGGAVTACSDDDLDKGIDNGVAEVDMVRYLNVSISNPTSSGSRAEGDPTFEAGVGQENYIHDLYFVFYDAQRMPTGEYYKMTFSNNETSDDNGTFTPSGGDGTASDNTQGTAGNVGKIWQSTIEVKLSQGQNLPSYVMAFVNPTAGNANFVKLSLDEIEKEKVTLVKLGDGHFPMSNSVYYGDNPISGETNARMVATPITTSQLFKTQEEAAASPAIEIYVERYAAKVNLTLDNTGTGDAATIKPFDGVNGYTLTFVPEYWRPNTIDQQEYAVKHYGLIGANNTPNEKPSYTDLINNFNWTWNDPDYYRSYWACSPSYYKFNYPRVSDNIEDVIRNAAGDGAYNHYSQYPYDLHYFTYNEIAQSKILNPDGTAAMTGAPTLQPSIAFTGNKFAGAFYSRETTASAKAWNGEAALATGEKFNPLATMASAVIVGRYKVTADDGTELPDNSTFYLYGKTGNNWNLYTSDEDLIKAMVKQQNTVVKNTAAQGETPNYQPVPVEEFANFVAEHPSYAVREIAGTPVAGRFVALQLKPDVTGYYWYNQNSEEDNKYEQITATNINNVNAELLIAGYARKYGEGLCYFSVPIKHLGFPENAVVDNLIKFEDCVPGSFGLVRNHVYNLNVSSITGLATTLRDPNQPIVPPADEQTYYISAKLNVLNWRIVPTQNVIL